MNKQPSNIDHRAQVLIVTPVISAW